MTETPRGHRRSFDEACAMRIERGSLVWLEYDAFLDSGQQFDSSEASGAVRIRVGEWEGLPGLGEKLIGLREGDNRLIRLEPAESFGDWSLNAVLTMRESRLDAGVRLNDGMLVRIETGTGQRAICRVFRIAEDRVALDFNHPLAGEALNLYIRVRKVARPMHHAMRSAGP
jgi:FKBP-type peptidyl-prolyl cis-trans isomerase SlpA